MATYNGTTGDDTYTGTSSGDSVSGNAGNDTLAGADGIDTIYGGAGNDSLSGGAGNDLIYGDFDTSEELLTNGNFNSGGTGWSTLNPTGGFGPQFTSGRAVFNAGGESVYGDSIYQTVTTAPGETYAVAYRGIEDNIGIANHTLLVEILDDLGNVIYSETRVVLNNTNNGWNFSFVAASGTSTIRFTNTTSTNSVNTDLKIDNVSILGPIDPVGNDTIVADDGDDLVYAGAGNDNLNGSAGNDTVYAGDGDDSWQIGDTGDDLVYGGAGSDILSGDLGNDTLYGDDGNDAIEGHEGVDVIYGGAGDDYVAGADITGITTPSNRTLDPTVGFDDASNDVLFGGDGNDTLIGNAGDDSLHGDAGNDYMVAGAGNDTVYAGAGNDTWHVGDTGDDLGYGGAGEDIISGDLGHDTLYGDGDNDAIEGHDGNDVIFGGAGDDYIVAADIAGLSDPFSRNLNPIINGDDNSEDQLYGGDGNDTLLGNGGRDTLQGGAGNDYLIGGAGPDLFIVEVADTITDFDASTGVSDNGNLDNDFVDLSAFYNATTLAIWNAANPGNQYDNALKWLRGDQADGVLQSAGGVQITDGGSAVAASLLNFENTAVCFAAGTRLATAKGHRPIEKLKVGDLVETADHGLQPIRWIGRMTVSGMGDLAPIRIAAGALGNRRDVLVSPLHRMLVAGWRVELLFGETEVIAAAKMLVNGSTIRSQPCAEVTYYHVMFDAHQILFAEGAGAESFHPGEEGFDALGPAACAEILAVFPQLQAGGFAAYGPSARRCLRLHEARLLQIGRMVAPTDQIQTAPRKRALAAQ